jgi:hypothetical protein
MGERPPAPLSPELERWILWAKFSAVIRARGGNPEEFREDFERALEAMKDLPFEEKQRRLEEMAISATPPPIVVARRPPAVAMPPVEAVAAPAGPGVVTRVCRRCGRTFTGPDEATLYYLERIFPFPSEYWEVCAVCKKRYFGYPPAPIMISQAMRYRMVHPDYWAFLSQLLRMLEERGGE